MPDPVPEISAGVALGSCRSVTIWIAGPSLRTRSVGQSVRDEISDKGGKIDT